MISYDAVSDIQHAWSDRVWTVPNVISLLRLAGVPLFLWLGTIARRFNQSSRIGALLDPGADRLYILATLPALRRHGYGPLPVRFLGEAATLCLLYAFPPLLIADHSGAAADIARPFAWAFTMWGVGLYSWAGWLYVVQFRSLTRTDARIAEARP